MTTLPTTPSPSRAERTRHAERAARAERTEHIVDLLRTASTDDDASLRRDLAEANLGVARSIASRYASRGVDADDLRQVACLALVRASQRFDPHAGHDFLSYCVPTIRGEIRRYFRDQDWSVRLPRRIQELRGRIQACEEELTAHLDRAVTATDLAVHLSVDRADVAAALSVDADRPLSLDRSLVTDGASTLGDLLGTDDVDLHRVEVLHTLGPAMRTLSDRDRRIVLLRFFHDCTQTEIGDLVGVTQMQVSRILSRILDDLRLRVGEVAA